MSQRPGNEIPLKAQVERGIFMKAEEGSHGILESMLGFALGLQREKGNRVIWGGFPRKARDPAEKSVST